MKRDINFIKHIKPQLKEKERTDKARGRQTRYENACRRLGLEEPPGVNLEDLGGILAMLKRFKP